MEPFSNAKLSVKDFKEIGNFIHSKLGIKMPETKRQMIESRLRKRLNNLEFNSYNLYKEYLFSKEGMANELPIFIDLVTTNKTDFFREPKHFDFIRERAIPEILEKSQKKINNLNIWSCACSRGDEPYTIAMVLSDMKDKGKEFDFNIYASDISRKVLNTALKAVYDESIVESVPFPLRKKYLLKSRDRSKKLVRVAPEIRKKVKFIQLNLMNSEYGFKSKMDIIFCRNVIIYFDNNTTQKLIKKLCNLLKPGGFLFMGHSEILECSSFPVTPVASTVYQKV